MKGVFLVLATTLLFYASSVQAARDDINYLGVQYSVLTHENDRFDDAEPTALVGRIGHFVTDNFAIEGRLGTGVEDDTIDIGRFKADVEIDTLAGVYGVLQSSSNNGLSIYGVLGYSRVEIEVSALGDSSSDDDSGLSYGAGLNYQWFNVEYMSYLDEDDYQVTALSLGFAVEF